MMSKSTGRKFWRGDVCNQKLSIKKIRLCQHKNKYNALLIIQDLTGLKGKRGWTIYNRRRHQSIIIVMCHGEDIPDDMVREIDLMDGRGFIDSTKI